MVMLVVMMTMFVIMVVSVVFAAIGCDRQLSVEVRSDQLFNGCICCAGPHRDAVVGEVGQGTVANPAGNHHLDALLTQPTRERARFVFGRRQHVRVQRDPLFSIHLDDSKLAAAAEVAV